MKTTNKSTSTKESSLNNSPIECRQLQQIFALYGQDALQPEFRTFQIEEGEDIELIPKMRLSMTSEEWYALCLDFRLLILKSFYERL
jgi:hypothetical protein